MQLTVTAVGRDLVGTDVLAEVEDGTTVAALTRAVAEAAGAVPDPRAWLGGQPLDPDAGVRAAGLLPGRRLGLAGPAAEPQEPADDEAMLELRVVGGPAAGQRWLLAPGRHGIGSGAAAAVRPESGGLPDHAGDVSVDHRGEAWFTPVAGSTARVEVAVPSTRPVLPAANGTPEVVEPVPPPVGQPSRWPLGADLAIGDTLLRLVEPSEPDAAVTPSPDVLGLDFNRPPRIVPPLLYPKQRYPRPPHPPGRRPIPLLVVLAPMLMGFAFVWFFHSLFYLVIMAFSPVLGMANWLSDRRSGRKRYRREIGEYWEKREKTDRAIAESVGAERQARCEASPDPASLRLVATSPGIRLWERRRRDPDYLVLRVGTLDQLSLQEIDDPAQDDLHREVRWTVPDVPAAVDLASRGVIGVVGDPGLVTGVSRWLLGQAVVLHSPRDLRLLLLTEAASMQDGEDRWGWLRWAPHARPFPGSTSGVPPLVSLGNDPETIAHRVAELLALIRARSKSRTSAMSSVVFAEPDVLVVLDGARRLRDVPGMVQILTEGPSVRVFVLCLEREERLLPEECTAVVEVTADGLAVRQTGLPTVTGVRADSVTGDWCEQVTRALAPLRDVTPEETGGLPDAVRLLELLGAVPPSAEEIQRAWQTRPASTSFLIGRGFEGPAALDLVRDGPHGLIAGTTGSGKSELLQSLVASLAIANRPDELTFVLVDYKGGSAFQSCVRLPHVLGMVTDLDAALVSRALESLAAELRRREELLARHGAKDLPEYRAMRRRDPALPPMPRLLLVIDEFATLVREVPDFVPGLVSIAQRGRSLGIHLILATQRPAGVVTSDIRANTNLRIALRVTDPSESMDVIDTNDAVAISTATPGRALVRLAHRSAMPFQTAYAGGIYVAPGDDEPVVKDEAPVTAVRIGWSALGRPAPVTAAAAETSGGQELDRTDLDVLVDEVIKAADRAGTVRQPSPWLPPLPSAVLLADLEPPRATGTGAVPKVPYGVQDLPAQQAQVPLLLDLDTLGHLYVLGAPRSGRSQLLRTIAGSIARSVSSADAHLYAIDAAGGSMAVLAELPHCGGVVGRADSERLDRLISRLQAEVTARQELLAQHACSGIVELRSRLAPKDRPAHIVVLVDGWDHLSGLLTDHDGGRLFDAVLGLLREGAGVGVHLVMASERALLAGRAATLSDNRILLRMNERSDYASIGLNTRELPDAVPPGRGWRSGLSSQLQVALLAADPSGQAQVEALRELAVRAKARDTGVPAARRPFHVRLLPSTIGFAEVHGQLTDDQRRPMWGLLGLGGDELTPVGVDFAGRASTFLVAGPAGSGRSNVLATLGVSLLATGTRLVVLTPRESPLRRLAAHPSVTVVPWPVTDPASLAPLLNSGPAVLLVDDVDSMGAHPLDQLLREVAGTGRDRGVGIAFAGAPEPMQIALSGWIADAKRARQGVLLAPQTLMEGDLLGTRIPGNLIRSQVRPGRGYVVDPGAGSLSAIVVPHTVLR